MIVVGGCGDYFDIHDTAILVDNYTVSDATERAHSVSDPPRSFMPSYSECCSKACLLAQRATNVASLCQCQSSIPRLDGSPTPPTPPDRPPPSRKLRISSKICQISRRFCVGRVQYAGRGLVHRLPWPESSSLRAVVPESVLGPSRGASAVSSAKRKRGCGSDATGGVAVAAAEEDGAGRGLAGTSYNGNAPGQRSGRQSSPAASDVGNGGKPDGVAGEREDATQQQGREGGPPQTDEQGACERERCECPCFCGRRHGRGTHGFPADGTGVVGTSSRASARVGVAEADLSRVEQLVGGAAMVRGCALGVRFVARATELSPGLSVSGALDQLDAATAAHGKEGDGEGERSAGGGLVSLFSSATERAAEGREQQDDGIAAAMASFCGGPLVALPRRFEVAATLHRLPGVEFRPAVATAAANPKLATSSAEATEEAAQNL